MGSERQEVCAGGGRGVRGGLKDKGGVWGRNKVVLHALWFASYLDPTHLCFKSAPHQKKIDLFTFKKKKIYLLEAYSPVNRTGSPQGLIRKGQITFAPICKSHGTPTFHTERSLASTT